MKANELRIGNFVFEDTKEEPLKVWGIKPDRRNHLMVNDCEIEIIRPIPITEEWLVRFKFNEGINKIYTSQSGYIIEFDDCFKFYLIEYGDWYSEIKHVHQLQNLYFSLTGEELTIKEDAINTQT